MLKISICGECVYMDANGWEGDLAGPMPKPTPMRFLEGFIISPNDDDYNCGHFSWDSCDGCGDTSGGSRYCYLATTKEEN